MKMVFQRLSLVVLSLFLLITLSTSAFANVEVFSTFDTILTINTDNTVEINKSLSIKNVFEVGIVPGQVEFKVARGSEGQANDIEITDVQAIDQFGSQIKTRVRNGDEFSVVVLDIFYPLLPGFEYQFDLYYKFQYKPNGIFFKSLVVPLRESTIPIEEGTFTVVLPKNYDFTYITEDGFNSIDGKKAIWNIKENSPREVSFEYSYLPVKTAGFARGSYVFWIIVNLILLLVLIFEVRRGIRRIRAQYAEEEEQPPVHHQEQPVVQHPHHQEQHHTQPHQENTFEGKQ